MQGMKAFVSAALGVGAIAVAVAAGAAVKPQTISLVEVQTSFVGMGGADPTFSTPPKPGQGFALTSDLYKWKGTTRGAHFGTLHAVCTLTKIDLAKYAAWQVCTGGAVFPGGQIAVAGEIPQADVFEVPIVGGTGVYAGARGYVRVKSIGGENSNTSADTFVITG